MSTSDGKVFVCVFCSEGQIDWRERRLLLLDDDPDFLRGQMIMKKGRFLLVALPLFLLVPDEKRHEHSARSAPLPIAFCMHTELKPSISNQRLCDIFIMLTAPVHRDLIISSTREFYCYS